MTNSDLSFRLEEDKQTLKIAEAIRYCVESNHDMTLTVAHKAWIKMELSFSPLLYMQYSATRL